MPEIQILALLKNLWTNLTIMSYKGSILQNYYAYHLSVCFLFRSIGFSGFFDFPACPAASGEERQKPISLFEGVHLAIKQNKEAT